MQGEKSSIERLRKKLYSRSGRGLGVKKRRRLRDLSKSVRVDWDDVPANERPRVNKHQVLTRMLIFSIVFFIGALSVSAFFFFSDRNTVSSGNIDIDIQGPATVKGGEELVLQILVTNKNSIPIEGVNLLVEYPDGTRAHDDLSKELLRVQEPLNRLDSNESAQKTIRAVLFGEEGSEESVKVTIEYRVKDSNAIFYREQDYEVVLSNAPLSLLVDSIEEISSGQDIEFVVTMVSNSENVIKDVLLIAQYPFGFNFESSDPKPSSKNNVWDLGDIKPEQRKVIRIRGNVLGEDKEERVFRFSTGIASKRDESKLETTFITTVHPIVVEKPFIGTGLAINGDTTSDIIVARDERIRADVTWKNNLLEEIYDAEIEVKIGGGIVDESTVSPQDGFYDSANNTVLWSRETLPSLSRLDEGSTGVVSFSFTPLQLQDNEAYRTPIIELDVTVRGQRVSERNVPETVESTIKRVLKVATDLSLASKVLYKDGPFQNTGPLPPKVENETTYTVVWKVENSTNPTGDVTVSATLPSYVKWLGSVSPQSEHIDFNDLGGQIRWTVGALESYSAREVAFQVLFSPSVSQVDTSPILVNQQRVDGVDTFTTRRMSSGGPALSISSVGDTNPAQGGKVVE